MRALRLLPLIVALVDLETEIDPPSLAVRVPPVMEVLLPVTVIRPPLALSDPPLTSAVVEPLTEIEPPPLAVREEPLPMLVLLDTVLAGEPEPP